ncbi:MAG: Osmo-dependent choline transporter BetT2 [Stenotrophomonas maltophilia]|uniref:Osmo-dependent choline transporter BetT2 n=1 Tax=Stenotrophomonas maltophilia TaxID=40324 RepID=A0A7V8FIS7_STEMA|nr:MAG: Osmo-dependent choline transporter BetT2 [Stenotrophomonas maltophilia]
MSNINMLLAIALVLFMLFAGPTQYLLGTLMQNAGDYLGSVVGKSFDVYAYGGRPEWMGSWTLFYWAWWIGWSPFVGLFIARISRGRTIRQFVFGVPLIPLGFTLAWLSIFGNSALDQVLHHGQEQLAQLAIDDAPTVPYALLDSYPWSRLVIGVTVLISFIFFVTSADSGAVVLSTLSSHGGAPEDDGPRWLRVFWGSVTAVVTGGLLLAGSMDALKSAVVLASLPFSAVLLLMARGLSKAFADESHRRRALQYRPTPLVGASRHQGWRQRLGQAVHFPLRDEVYRFMDSHVRPAMEAVAAQLREQGWEVEATLDANDMSLPVNHGEQQDFLYRVLLTGYRVPSFASHNVRNQRYYRAEVHLFEGSQDYDLVGYSREQIINDIIGQYERHLQFLHLSR